MQIAGDNFKLQNSQERHDSEEATSEWEWYHLLPLAAAAIYIFTPVLIWRFGLPGVTKFLGELIVIVMIGLAIGRMIRTDNFPGAFLVILALSITGIIVATFEGQSTAVTLYGWWMLFGFPMVGLYVYLVPSWPKSIPRLIPKVLTVLLVIEVIAQILLYLTGTRDYDNLAGTFGQKGVGPFVYFILLTLAVALGRWLVFGEWKMLFIVLVLSSFASAMGEMKLFMIAAPMMAAVTLGIHFLRGAQPRRILIYLTFFAVAVASFLFAYDRLIVQNLGRPALEEFLNQDRRERYLNNVRGGLDAYRLGRNTEAEYGWQLVQRDATTVLFGYGLGTRQHSSELGLTGEGLRESLYGLFVGRSLLVMLYEMGVVGLFVMLVFVVITSLILYRATKRDPDPHMNVLRYGVLIYTIFWPVWIWYKAVWIMPAPSILYWMIWGYVMHYSVSHSFHRSKVAPNRDIVTQS